ncbi:MAG: ATP synthase F1 subunit gamma [Lachnospiraceae bacterium]|nr:ATP synthase F1 subunit gamma [Lachnospiraceae bacterium]
MANMKAIRDRIDGVSNTKKITNAMYLISSTKLQKAKKALEDTRPYFLQQELEIKRIFQSEADINSRYFYPKTGRKPAEMYAYLVITSDKGLAGAYNFNVLKRTEEEMKKHKKVKLYVVGEYGRRYFTKRKIPIEQSFLYTAQEPTFRRAREICYQLLTEYDSKRVDEIRVIYSDMENELASTVKMMRLLPFERKPFLTPAQQKNQVDVHYKFYPSVTEVIDRCMPGYISGFIYGALVDSFSAEQNARMNAMSSANRNAEELIADLTLQYNGFRQSAITQEITEISAGAKALRGKQTHRTS